MTPSTVLKDLINFPFYDFNFEDILEGTQRSFWLRTFLNVLLFCCDRLELNSKYLTLYDGKSVDVNL